MHEVEAMEGSLKVAQKTPQATEDSLLKRINAPSEPLEGPRGAETEPFPHQ